MHNGRDGVDDVDGTSDVDVVNDGADDGVDDGARYRR